MNRFQVRKVAVLGAGVMGAQIAAHLVNCRVPVVLFATLAQTGKDMGAKYKETSEGGLAANLTLC